MTEIRIKTTDNKSEKWENIKPIEFNYETNAYVVIMGLISPDAPNIYEIRLGTLNQNGKYFQGAAW